MSKTITILSPLDLKPGTVNPDGRVVESSTMYVDGRHVIVEVKYTDQTVGAHIWPSGSGWEVNGRKAE